MTKKTLRGAALAIAEFIFDNYEDVRDNEYQHGRFKDRVFTPNGGEYYTATSGRDPFDPSKHPGWENLRWQEQFSEHFNKRYNNRVFKLVPATTAPVPQTTPEKPSKRLTLASVNKTIGAEGIDAELVQGEGYLYFIGPDVEYAKSTSVMVARLNHLTLERWLEEAKSIHDESKTRKADLEEAEANGGSIVVTASTSDSTRGRQPTLQQAISLFVEEISNIKAKDTAAIQQRCEKEIQSLDRVKVNTRKTYIMRYRAAVTQSLGDEHPALNYLSASGLSAQITAKAQKEQEAEQFDPMANAPTSSLTKPSSRQEAVEAFTEKMRQARSQTEMRAIWDAEFSSLASLNESSQKLYVSKYYRKELAKHFAPDSKVFEIVKVPDEIMERISLSYRRKVIEEHKKLVHIPQWQGIIDTATRALTVRLKDKTPTKESAMVMAAALLVLTGRRPYEIVSAGHFNAAPLPGGVSSAKSKWSVMFEGQTKTRGAAGTRHDSSYEIPVLAPARTILDAVSLLRSSPEGRELSKLSNEEFSALTNSRGISDALPLRAAVEDLYKTHWPAEAALSPKCLRPLYAEIAYKMFAASSVSKNSFFARVLGHKANDLETSLSYMDYYLDDNSDAAAVATRTQKRALNDMEKRNVSLDKKKNHGL